MSTRLLRKRPSRKRDAGEHTSDVPVGADADVWSSTKRCAPAWVVPGVAGSPGDEDKIKAKLAGFEVEAVGSCGRRM